MAMHSTRRQFVKATGAAALGYWVAGGVQPKPSYSANEEIQFACIGIGGKGSSDSGDASSNGKVVAICDVDHKRLEAAAKRFDGPKTYYDFRKLFEEMGDKIDAVTVSTPDHTHAASALMAMRMGKHCFCQKPLTHTIYEARLMAETAKETGVQTMMGNQGTARDGLREAAAMIKAGLLGDIKAVHVWSNRPIWPQGGPRPEPKPVPEGLEWDLWIGPAPFREYAPGYHPFAWRGWWDFGTGALGDMACHTVNMPFAGCDLYDPTAVQATTSGHNHDSYPKWSIIQFWYPANDWRSAIEFFWYDGGKKPDPSILEGFADENGKPIAMKGSGAVVIGEKGKLYSPDDYGSQYFLAGVDKIDVEYEKSPGHFAEWVRAIKTGKPAMSNFANYAGRLTETILLGNLAVWVADQPEELGKKVEWDAKNLKCTNMPELNDTIVKPTYRDGYILDA